MTVNFCNFLKFKAFQLQIVLYLFIEIFKYEIYVKLKIYIFLFLTRCNEFTNKLKRNYLPIHLVQFSIILFN